jgi:hypothetical protein
LQAPRENATPPPLTLAERKRGRKLYYSYASFNALSYPALAEAIVILILLRLGGNAVWVGAVSAMTYATLPFMLLGYRMVRRLGVARNAGLFWTLRSLCAGFLIAAPWAAHELGAAAGLWFVFLGALGFFTARAAGMISFTGIITELTTARERGALIAHSFKLFQGGALVMTLLIALFLGEGASLHRYQIFFALGLLTGLAAALSLWNIPEAGQFRQVPPFRLREELRWLLGTRGRRWFFAMMTVIPMTHGVTRTFLIVVAKEGCGLDDQQALLFVVIATVGGIAASYAYGLFLDKLGSRPLLVLTGLLDIGAVLLVVLLPGSFSYPLLGVIFFLKSNAQLAFTALIQHYFISITDREHQLTQGIITQAVGGIAGGLALYLSGNILEVIKGVTAGGTDPLLPFRWFFGGMLVLLVVRAVILYHIPRLQSHGIRDSLNVLLSPWDWRAIHAVKRAVAIQSEDEETRSLELIMRSGSGIYREELESFLLSPSFAIRERAMEALAVVEPKTALIDILIKDLRENHFTTASRAAYWLGRWQAKRAIPALREAVDGPDATLRGRAIQALVDLEDRDALPLIRRRFLKSAHPLVLMEGARAFSRWGGVEVYPELLDKLRVAIPPQVKDELALSVARLVNLYDTFYRDLSMYRRDAPQLFSEWGARYGAGDEEGLLAGVREGSLSGETLRKAMEGRADSLQSWFAESTAAFLAEQGGTPVEPGLAFLLAFLLLHPSGEHRR